MAICQSEESDRDGSWNIQRLGKHHKVCTNRTRDSSKAKVSKKPRT